MSKEWRELIEERWRHSSLALPAGCSDRLSSIGRTLDCLSLARAIACHVSERSCMCVSWEATGHRKPHSVGVLFGLLPIRINVSAD